MKNVVERAVKAVGGTTPASRVCQVSYWTVRDWRRDGVVPLGRSAVLLARACKAVGHRVTVDELVGLEPLNGHK